MTPELSNSGIPQGQVDVLAGIYREAAAKLRGIVLGPPGKTAKAQQFNQGRASQQLVQVEALIDQLKHRAAHWIGDARDGSSGPVTVAVRDGIKRADQQAAEVGVRPAGHAASGSFNLIDAGTVELFAREIYADLGKSADGMGEQAKRVLRTTAQQKLSEADIDRVLAGGVIAGKPVDTIRALRDQLKAVHGDQVPIQTKSGNVIHFDVGYYAQLVARTKTREASVHARHERLQKLGLHLVAIVGLVSKNFCTAFLGQVFALDGKSSKYPPYSSLPGGGAPFHPLCSKSTRPFVEELASAKQREQAQGVDDEEKMRGIDAATAQRRFKDLQIYAQVKGSYATTAKALFGKSNGDRAGRGHATTKDAGVTATRAASRPSNAATRPASGPPGSRRPAASTQPALPPAAPPAAEFAAGSGKTGALQAKLDAARAARAAAEAELQRAKAELEGLRAELAAAQAAETKNAEQIAALKRRIQVANAVAKAYVAKSRRKD